MSSKNEKKIEGLNQRFIQVMEVLGHSGYTLSKALDTSEAVISNVRLGKNPPNVVLVERLLNKYKVVDADWLLTGNGRMFKVSGADPSGSTSADSLSLSAKMDEMLKLLKRSIEVQLHHNLMVDESIAQLEKRAAGRSDSRSKLKKVPRT